MTVATSNHSTEIDSINARVARKRRNRNNLIGWCFLLPSFIGFLLFRFLPIISTTILGFTDWNLVSGIGGIQFNGVDNFIQIAKDKTFWIAFGNTFAFVLGSVPVTIILALILAVILNDKVFLKGGIRLMIYLPYISSLVAVSVVWLNLFSPSYGPINTVLQSLGISNPPGWVTSSEWALPALMIISVWQSVGYYMVIFVAGLQGISPSYYEAARIDGASGLRCFFKITIPMLTPTLFFVLITSVINSFQNFTLVNVMTQGGPGTSTMVLVYYVYRMVIKYSKVGYACAVSVVLFIILFIITAIQLGTQKKWVHFE